jgi:adenylate cyclase
MGSAGAIVSTVAVTWLIWGWLIALGGGLLLVLLLKSVLGFVRELLACRALWQTMRCYFPIQRWEVMRRSPKCSLQAPVVERELTVMFCDWRGFSALAERETPRRLHERLMHVMSEITQTIEGHGGTVDKYMGDCVMAFWGAPHVNLAHARDAVAAANAIVELIKSQKLIDKFPDLSGLDITIGIHTGMVVVGDMGSTQRQSYTVVGDVVNVASRLQNQCANQGVRVLVSACTAHRNPWTAWTPLGAVHLNGRQQAVDIYTPI